MWFDYLATYPIELNVRSEMCRFDLSTLNEHKIKSMKAVHRWVCEFFTNPRCFEDACANKYQETAWFSELDFRNIDGVNACIINTQRAYKYFQHWCKDSGTKIPTGSRNFVEDLREIGIKSVRKRMPQGKCRPSIYLFMRPYVKKTLKGFYNLDKLPIGEWCFEDPDEFIKLQNQVKTGNWRFHVGGRNSGHSFQ